MVNPDALQYIDERLRHGVNHDVIHKNLIDAGYDEKDINEAFVEALKHVNHKQLPNLNLASTATYIVSMRSLIPFHTLFLITLKEFGIYFLHYLSLSILLSLYSIFLYYLWPRSLNYLSTNTDLLSILLFLIVVIVWLWGFFAIYITPKNKFSIINSYKYAFLNWPKLLYTAILSGLALCGGFIFFLIPGIVLFTRLIFTPFIIIEEKLFGIHAMAASSFYSRSYGVSILYRLFLIFIFQVLILSVAHVLFFYLFGNGKLLFELNYYGIGIEIYLIRIVELFISILFFPITIIFLHKFYENLKTLHPHALEESLGGKKLLIIYIIAPILIISYYIWYGSLVITVAGH